MRPHSYASRLGPAEGFLPTAPGALSYVVLYSRVAAAGGWTVRWTRASVAAYVFGCYQHPLLCGPKGRVCLLSLTFQLARVQFPK